jgi:hypothetical protein
MLQVFHEQTRQGWAQAKVVPSGAAVPPCAAAGAEHKAISIGVAAGVEHEAASMGG